MEWGTGLMERTTHMATQTNKLSPAIQAQVGRWIAAAGASGEADGYAGKRHATRFADGLYLEVTLDPAKPSATWGVYMHNVSGGGCAFWSKREVPLRGMVSVRHCGEDGPGPWIAARVTHCTRGLRGFLVGVSFQGQAL
jgi:hypothetical protein